MLPAPSRSLALQGDLKDHITVGCSLGSSHGWIDTAALQMVWPEVQGLESQSHGRSLQLPYVVVTAWDEAFNPGGCE